MNKDKLYVLLTGLFCSTLLISNILAVKTFTVLGLTLPAAVIVFPIVYIVNDVMTEIYGFQGAKTIIKLGFVMNLIAVISYAISIKLPPSEFCKIQQSFSNVLSNTPRVLLASMLAYLAGSLTNSYIMQKLKEQAEKYLMLRCILSTLFGEGIDAFVFITISFAGTMPVAALVIMAISQALFKTGYEIVIYPVTKSVISKARRLEG